MRRIAVLIVVMISSCPAWAQATIATFASSATDPNLSVAMSTRSYTATCGVAPKLSEVVPIVNPVEGAYDDPADATKDCRIDISQQVSALPVGTGYKAALKLGAEPFGPFTTAFAVSAQTTTLTILAGQSFTVRASHPCTNATAYRLVIDNISGPNLPLTACAGGTITATSPGVTAGAHTVALAAVDAVSEKRGPSLTIQANAPQTVAPGTPSVTQP